MIANTLLFIHFGFVLTVLISTLLIAIGGALRWRWIRNFWIRIVHVGIVVLVAIQALLGFYCPLTIWEENLRGESFYPEGFIAYWIHRLLYYDIDLQVLALIYAAFAAFVIALFFVFPPLPRSAFKSSEKRDNGC